jgi:DNA excision repair protein ERCC-8
MFGCKLNSVAECCSFSSILPKDNDSGLCSYETGTDSRVRLWDIESGCNTLVNYEATRIRAHHGTQLAVSMDSSLLFVASAHSIQVVNFFLSVYLRISLDLHIGEIAHCTHCPHNHLSYYYPLWQTYDIWSGRMHSKLVGHYDNVNCCAFLPEDQVPSNPDTYSHGL